MGLGVREPSGSNHVSGTVTLYENGLVGVGAALEENGEAPFGGLNKRRDGEILLVPQPSDSLNDPLNWPLWKKDLTFFTICFAVAVGVIVGPSLAPINTVLTAEFHTSYTTVANFSGYQFFASGVAGLLCEVMARLWGKRPVYVLSTACVFAGALWNSMVKAGDVGGFMGARVLQGVGLGAFETLVVSSIGDLYFVHQRAKRIAFYNTVLLGTSYFMPVIGGYVSTKYGWRMQFKIMAAFLGPALLMVFLLCPEHVFVRDKKFETDLASEDSSSGSISIDDEKNNIGSTVAPAEPKKTFLQELKLYNGRFSNESFWKLLLAPFPCMIYPAAIWVFLLQGTFVTWGIAVAIVLAEMFSIPPYNFTPTQLGYIYAAPTVGAILAYVLCIITYDRICLHLTKRNKFTYEPEFRIILVIPIFFIGIPGLMAYGYAATTPGLHWIVPSILYGMLTFAVVLSCIASYSYLLDAHRALSVELMVAVLLLKNFFAWGSTYYISDWLVQVGPRRLFMTVGLIQAVICVGSVVVYVYGKVWRARMDKVRLLERLGLRPGMVKK